VAQARRGDARAALFRISFVVRGALLALHHEENHASGLLKACESHCFLPKGSPAMAEGASKHAAYSEKDQNRPSM
jgi:hypothetical protein